MGLGSDRSLVGGTNIHRQFPLVAFGESSIGHNPELGIPSGIDHVVGAHLDTTALYCNFLSGSIGINGNFLIGDKRVKPLQILLFMPAESVTIDRHICSLGIVDKLLDSTEVHRTVVAHD